MIIPAPADVAVGDKITASRWNQLIDVGQFLMNPPRATVFKSAGTTSMANNTFVLTTFDTEDEDTDGIHSTASNTSRLTVATAGAYRVDAIARWASGTGTCSLDVRRNANGSPAGGTSVAALSGPLGSVTGGGISLTRRLPALAAGDYVELFLLQATGGALNLLGGAVNLTSFAITFEGTT